MRHLLSARPDAASQVSLEALRFLDEVCAPLTVRKIERALRDRGISKSQWVVLASALSGLTVIAIKPKDER